MFDIMLHKRAANYRSTPIRLLLQLTGDIWIESYGMARNSYTAHAMVSP